MVLPTNAIPAEISKKPYLLAEEQTGLELKAPDESRASGRREGLAMPLDRYIQSILTSILNAISRGPRDEAIRRQRLIFDNEYVHSDNEKSR